LLPLARAAVDDVVAFVELVQELRDLLRRVLQIVVNRYDRLPARSPDPGEQRVVLTVIPRQIEASNTCVEPRELGDPLPAVVAATVVDEDELILERAGAECLRDAFREQSERRAAVVDRDDDGDFRGQRSPPVPFWSRTDGLYACPR
jgi:hypothetical protein